MKFTRLLLIAILTFFITCGQDSAEDVALNAIKALISGNDKKLSEYFALDEVTKSQGEQSAIKSKLKETSQELQEKIAKNGGLKDILVLNSTDEDDGYQGQEHGAEIWRQQGSRREVPRCQRQEGWRENAPLRPSV